MEIIVFWLLLSVAVAVWAGNRGRNSFGWFLIAAVVSPLIAAIFLAVLANLATTEAAVTANTHGICPACSEPVLLSAIVCKHCKTNIGELGGPQAIERKKTIKDSKGYKIVFWAIFWVVVAGFIFGRSG